MALGGSVRDRYGLALSTHSTTAADAYVEGVDRLMSLNAGADEALGRASEADACFALPSAALAILHRFRGDVAEAHEAIRRAIESGGSLSRREQQHLSIVESYVKGDAARALALAREHLAAFPQDALVLSQIPFMIHVEGGDRRPIMLAVVEDLAPAYGDDWWFAGFAAIFYQEMDQFERARELASRSLERSPRNASAVHPLAHVFYETDDHASGVDFLRRWLPGYEREAPYHSHLSWHLALCELASGHYDRVMTLYEEAIAPAAARTRLSFYDAASLLWRFEVYGCVAGPLPWGDVLDLGLELYPRPGVPFADAMMGLACAGASDETALARLVDGLRALAAGGHPVAGSVMVPLVEGVAAFGRADYETAVGRLEPLVAEVPRIGGTNAQREVFEDTLLEAHLRAGQFDRAEALLRKRLNRRPSTRDFLWLGRAQASSGRVDEARSSFETARGRWADVHPESPELRSVDRAIALAT